MHIDEVFERPSLLATMRPEEFSQAVVGLHEGWLVEALRRGSRAGGGWVLREYGLGSVPTGRVICWHPGGGRHGLQPYWRVSSPDRGRSGIIR